LGSSSLCIFLQSAVTSCLLDSNTVFSVSNTYSGLAGYWWGGRWIWWRKI